MSTVSPSIPGSRVRRHGVLDARLLRRARCRRRSPKASRAARSRTAGDRWRRDVKVITWNVNGIRARQREVGELLAAEQPDIVCLQEIKAPAGQGAGTARVGERLLVLLARRGRLLGRGAARPSQFLHGTTGLRSSVFRYGEPHRRRPTSGPWSVASVYVPNGGKDYDAKAAVSARRSSAWALGHIRHGQTLVICGDLNVAREERDVHPKERKPNQIGTRPEERGLLRRVCSEGLVDVGRRLDPDNNELFTWWAPWRNLRQRNIGWRIDYVLASAALARPPRARCRCVNSARATTPRS